MDLIETIFQSTEFKHDRFFDESFELPYDFDSVKIQPNDLATFRSFNLAVDKLYDNFMYIYGVTKMGSNVIPEALSGFAGVSAAGADIKWYSSDATFVNFSASNISYFDDAIINNVVYSDILGQNILITCSISAVVVSKTPSDNSSFTIILSSNKAEANSDLFYKNITSATVNGDYLYVVDNYYNNLYRYNIAGFISDVSIPQTLTIERQVGGKGNFTKNYKFNDIRGIAVLGDKIYVNDAGNYAIKIYDLNLNFVKMVHKKDIFYGDKCKIISADENSGSIFCITENKNFYIFNSDIEVINSVPLASVFPANEVIKNLFIGKSYDNAYYIVTDKTIYKFYISKPRNLIGKFTLYRLGANVDTQFAYADSVVNDNNVGDWIYILATLDGVKRIIKVKDSENFADVLSLNNFEIYTNDEVRVNADEYSQTWVYSKSISKLILNHARLKDKMIGRFYATHDEQENLLLTGFYYYKLDDLDLTAYRITLDHFPGNNEIFLNTVLNRGLRKVFDLQQIMINKSNTIIADSPNFDNSSIVVP